MKLSDYVFTIGIVFGFMALGLTVYAFNAELPIIEANPISVYLLDLGLGYAVLYKTFITVTVFMLYTSCKYISSKFTVYHYQQITLWLIPIMWFSLNSADMLNDLFIVLLLSP